MGKLARQIKRNKVRMNIKMANRDKLRRQLKAMGIPYHEDNAMEVYEQKVKEHEALIESRRKKF